MGRRVALNPRPNPLNHTRDHLPTGDRIVEEMKAHALAYFTEHGEDSPIGTWLWNLAARLEPQLSPVPDNVIAFPRQRTSAESLEGVRT